MASSGAQADEEKRAEEQQPPSLERQEYMLRRWRCSVNRPSMGEGSQVAGVV